MSVCGETGSFFPSGQAYRPFLSAKKAQTRIKVYRSASSFSVPQGRRVFDALGNWTLERCASRYIFSIYDKELGTLPYLSAVLSYDLKTCDIYIPKNSRRLSEKILPLEYPLDEILFINLLSQKHGILAHGCGIVYDKNGWVFAGASGAGKSTMVRLWQKVERVKVLNDDRLALRRVNNKWWVYGTPWHGAISECSPDKAPLKAIFFLKHGTRNTLKKLKNIEAVTFLVATSFPPLWDKKMMADSIKHCSDLALKIPCYELVFSPTEDVISFLKCHF